MIDPIHFAHSRRIIEIGAMAVRNHTTLDPKLDDNKGLSAHERILKKLEDVERYLQQYEAHNEDALSGCKLIREALSRRKGSVDASHKLDCSDGAAEDDPLEAPSKMMPADDDGLFGGCLDEDDLLGLLTTENKRLGDDE
jgi:hypothetical protein